MTYTSYSPRFSRPNKCSTFLTSTCDFRIFALPYATLDIGDPTVLVCLYPLARSSRPIFHLPLVLPLLSPLRPRGSSGSGNRTRRVALNRRRKSDGAIVLSSRSIGNTTSTSKSTTISHPTTCCPTTQLLKEGTRLKTQHPLKNKFLRSSGAKDLEAEEGRLKVSFATEAKAFLPFSVRLSDGTPESRHASTCPPSLM